MTPFYLFTQVNHDLTGQPGKIGRLTRQVNQVVNW